MPASKRKIVVRTAGVLVEIHTDRLLDITAGYLRSMRASDVAQTVATEAASDLANKVADPAWITQALEYEAKGCILDAARRSGLVAPKGRRGRPKLPDRGLDVARAATRDVAVIVRRIRSLVRNDQEGAAADLARQLSGGQSGLARRVMYGPEKPSTCAALIMEQALQRREFSVRRLSRSR